MDAITSFLTGIASGVATNFATDAIKQFFSAAVELNPGIADEMEAATSNQDVERIFNESIGVIDAHAGDGSIDVDGSLLTALRGIRFDHAQGLVYIGNSVVQAPVLETGGGSGATGQTTVGGNTNLKSQGTEIRVGKGAAIKITGNAKIKQT